LKHDKILITGKNFNERESIFSEWALEYHTTPSIARFNILTFCIMVISIMIFNKNTLCKMTLNIIKLIIKTFSVMKLNKITLIIKKLILKTLIVMTLSITINKT